MRYKELPEDYSLVLRQIGVDGGDDLSDLLDSAPIDRGRLRHIITALHHKGLITIGRMGHGTWLSLSTKGRRLMSSIWPAATLRYSH